MRHLALSFAALIAACGGSSDGHSDAAGVPDGPIGPDGAGADGAAAVDAAGAADGPAVDGNMSVIDGAPTASDGGVIFPLDGGVALADAAPLPSCAPSGGCPVGPQCGTTCCRSGESCDPATGTCRCGAGPACGAGDMCVGPGPVGPEICGIVCCGSSGPCPF